MVSSIGSAGGADAQGAPGAHAQGPPSYVLVHRARTGNQPLFPPLRLRHAVTYIGRLLGNDVVLESELVSRRHAKLIVSDLGVTVHDLDSHNGIFLNGKKVRSTPVHSGDLLYVGDVCLAIRPARAGDAPIDDVEGLNKSDLLVRAQRSGELSAEGDPAVRNLAALVRATDLLLGADEHEFRAKIVEICRDLTEATIAVFLERRADGVLEAPVVLQPAPSGGGAPADGEPPVSWPVVRRCIDESVTLFSKDVEKDPLVPNDPLSAGERGAVMCVPVLSSGGPGDERATVGALFLSRTQAGSGFTDREVETVSAVAHLVAAKLRPPPVVDEGTSPGTKQALGEAVAAKARVDADLQAARAEATALRAELDAAKAGGASSRGEADKLRADGEKARGEAEKARAELEKLRADADRARADLERQDAAMRRIDDARAQEAAERKKADDEAKRLRAEVERLSEASAKEGDDVARLKDEVDRLRAELRTAVDDAARAAHERDIAAGEQDKLATEVERLAAALQATEQDAAHRVEEAGRDAEAVAGELSALRDALKDLTPRAVGARLESIAEGTELDDKLASAPATVLYISLSGCDGWAAKAATDDVKQRLDKFCAAVHARAKANGGDVVGVLGHAHLVSFAPDAAGVRGAVRCAVEVAALVPLEAQGGVQAGLHTSATLSGFCGEGAGAVLVSLGEAVAVARGAADWAQPGTVYATDAVRGLLGGDPAFMLIGAGPSLIRGIPAPVNLYLVSKAEGLPT